MFVKPFRRIDLKMLPTPSFKNTFKLHWKPLYLFVEKATNLKLDYETRDMKKEEVDAAFSVCLEYLKLR